MSKINYYACVVRCLLTMSMSLSQINFGFIYEVRIIEKWSQSTQSTHYFIALSDFHDKTHASTVEQQAQLEHIMARCNKQNTKMIVEDLSSCASNGRNSCGPFVINSRGGILGGITQHYQKSGLHVDNVEYRYCRVASLGPVINNIEQHTMPFQSTQAISVGVLLQEIEDNIKEIKTFNDGAALQGLYQRIVHDVQKELSKLKLNNQRTVSVANYMHSCSTHDTRADLLHTLLTVDSPLLDIKIMHSVKHSPEKIIICLGGGSHMIRVCNWLVQYDGYKQVYATPVRYAREYNRMNCIGVPLIEDSYCMRPEPIDISVVKDYLPEH